MKSYLNTGLFQNNAMNHEDSLSQIIADTIGSVSDCYANEDVIVHAVSPETLVSQQDIDSNQKAEEKSIINDPSLDNSKLTDTNVITNGDFTHIPTVQLIQEGGKKLENEDFVKDFFLKTEIKEEEKSENNAKCSNEDDTTVQHPDLTVGASKDISSEDKSIEEFIALTRKSAGKSTQIFIPYM